MHKLRQIPALLTAAAVIVSLLLFSVPALAAGSDDAAVTIYHTGDTGGLLSASTSANGSSRISAALLAAIASSDDSILIDAGNSIVSYSKDGTVFDRWDSAAVLDAAGYSVVVPGSEDLGDGLSFLTSSVAECGFDMLCANAKLSLMNPFANDRCNGSYIIRECAGKKIGILGISSIPAMTEGNDQLTFEHPYDIANSQIILMKTEGADAVVVVVNITPGSEDISADKLAKNIKGADAFIVAGNKSSGIITSDGIPVSQTGSDLRNLGKISLDWNDEGKLSISASILSVQEVADSFTPVSSVTELCEKILTPSDPVKRVISLISMLPETITESNIAQVNAAREAYDALPDEMKSQVTNYSTLIEAQVAVMDLGEVSSEAETSTAEKIVTSRKTTYVILCAILIAWIIVSLRRPSNSGRS